MSLTTEGISCVRCKSYLFPEDDIVYCPVCGAPHHRECYNYLGHCALEELHGTEREYTPPEIKETSNENDNSNNQIKDHKSNIEYLKNEGFVMFDMLGGVPADYKFNDNVTADDAKKFVLANTHRYIPKFATLNKENKTSWNWAAFLFPAPWMISRKMYKAGIISAIFTIISTLLSIPLNLTLNNLGLASTSYYELASFITENISQIGISVIIISFFSLFVNIALRVYCALFSDYWYKKYSISTIGKIKKNGVDIDLNYRKSGGINVFYFFIAMLLLEYIPLIIYTLI